VTVRLHVGQVSGRVCVGLEHDQASVLLRVVPVIDERSRLVSCNPAPLSSERKNVAVSSRPTGGVTGAPARNKESRSDSSPPRPRDAPPDHAAADRQSWNVRRRPQEAGMDER
jgi:hypothetical protein